MRVTIRPESETRAATEAAFDRHRRRVLSVVPDAHIEHIGSTAVPGAVTKGDIDLLVRVGAESFERAVSELRSGYSVHQPENWTPTYASFSVPDAADPAVGVQLVVMGSDDDVLLRRFRDSLVADPELLEEYNELKLRHDGEEYGPYTRAKEKFIEKRFRGSV